MKVSILALRRRESWQKVAVYIRHSGTRKYEKANPKILQTYQGRLLPGASFVLRFTDANGKRQALRESLDCGGFTGTAEPEP